MRRRLQVLLFMAAWLSLNGCSRNSNLFDTPPTGGGGDIGIQSVDSGPPTGLKLTPFSVAVTADLKTPASPPVVDILITVDNEKDLYPQLDNFIALVPNWVTALQKRGLDFQVGALRSTGTSQNIPMYSDALLGSPAVVQGSSPSAATQIAGNLQLIRDIAEDEIPRPFRLAVEAYQDPKNNVLFRPKDIPVFLLFSDFEDQDYDATPDEAVANVESFLTYFRTYTPNSNWMVSAFGSPSANPCPANDTVYEPFIEPLTLRSGGAFLRFCEDDFTSSMQAFAQAVLSAATSLDLSAFIPGKFDVDPDSFQVKVAGNAVAMDSATGFAWNPYRHAISFPGNYVPAPSSTVEVYFEYLEL